jgi:predicted Zn finger-like uncharacterized protein
MSLATRCPACGTTFRVVQDQLKVSEGWVRCGRCEEAFNALEGLFDLERDSGPMPLADESSTHDESTAPTERMPLDELPSHRVDDSTPPVPSDIAPDKVHGLRQVGYSEYLSQEHSQTSGSADESRHEQAHPEGSAAQPEFLRRAQRAAMWRKPGVRILLTAACVVAAAGLALQWAIHQRDLLAAQRPDWAPMLAALCEPVGCKIEPLRDIAAIVVDSSDLEATASASQFRFGAVLRNQSAVTVATPSLDLSLTDDGGKVVLRKTLMPSDFGASVPITLAAGSEVQLRTLLDVATLRVVGYSVLAYYP